MDFPGKHYFFFVYLLKTELSENIQKIAIRQFVFWCSNLSCFVVFFNLIEKVHQRLLMFSGLILSLISFSVGTIS